MNHPLFSIITVCYNAAENIAPTIQSVLGQTEKDYEYLFIDGGSTDDTVERIRETMRDGGLKEKAHSARATGEANHSSVDLSEDTIGKPRPEWRVISEKDRGIYDAMNKAVRMASGEYLYFLNAGDAFHDANVLAAIRLALKSVAAGTPSDGKRMQPSDKHANHFDGNRKGMTDGNLKPDLVYGEVQFCYPDHPKVSQYVSQHALDYRKIAQEKYVCHQAVFARRELYERHPFDLQFRYMADNEWMAYWSKQGASVEGVDCVICDFDTQGVSQSEAGSKQALWEADEIAKRYWPAAYHVMAPVKAAVRRVKSHGIESGDKKTPES